MKAHSVRDAGGQHLEYSGRDYEFVALQHVD
jgi:hypothetical protein